MQEEAESGIKEYETTYLPAIEKILDDETLKKLKEDSGLEGRIDKKMTQIDQRSGNMEKKIRGRIPMKMILHRRMTQKTMRKRK